MVSLKCPNCGSPLESKSFDTTRGTAKCGYCGALMSLGTPAAADGFRSRPPMALPEGLRCEEGVAETVITRRWFTPAVLFLIFFCVAWDSFLVFWYSMAFTQRGVPWIMVVFPVAHVAVGVGLTYFVIASLLNRTVITAGRGSLSVRHGPVPWRGGGAWRQGEIDQLFCKAKQVNGKNGESTNYELHAVLRAGQTQKLVGIGMTEEQVLYLEQKLEKALNIQDRAVPGELPR